MSMSDPALTDHVARTAQETAPLLRETLESVAVLLALPVQFVSFWVATLLPFTYVPLLATGVATAHPTGFAALVGANALAFVLGHPYKQAA